MKRMNLEPERVQELPRYFKDFWLQPFRIEVLGPRFADGGGDRGLQVVRYEGHLLTDTEYVSPDPVRTHMVAEHTIESHRDSINRIDVLPTEIGRLFLDRNVLNHLKIERKYEMEAGMQPAIRWSNVPCSLAEGCNDACLVRFNYKPEFRQADEVDKELNQLIEHGTSTCTQYIASLIVQESTWSLGETESGGSILGDGSYQSILELGAYYGFAMLSCHLDI